MPEQAIPVLYLDLDGTVRQGKRVPVTWFYRAGVRRSPRVPTTTDQKASEAC